MPNKQKPNSPQPKMEHMIDMFLSSWLAAPVTLEASINVRTGATIRKQSTPGRDQGRLNAENHIEAYL